MGNYSKLEQETIILFNEAEDMAEVYTHNVKLQNRLNKFKVQHPDLVSVQGFTYTLPKKLLRIFPMQSVSEEQRAWSRQLGEKNKGNLQSRGQARR